VGQQAQNVTITRDDLGIAHVKGNRRRRFWRDHAQAEDDFNRVETNYQSQGRLTGRGRVGDLRDLRMKLFIDPADMSVYEKSPARLKRWTAGRTSELLPLQTRSGPRVIKRTSRGWR
jgi:acyl-homoserine-lactone acylase